MNKRGDTIVEVMIVLAVLGLAIGVTYATANRSLLATRQAQENSEATALLRSQAELLRYLAPNGSTAPSIFNISKPNYFCIDTSNKVTAFSLGAALTPLASPSPYPAGCVRNARYYLAVQYVPPGAGGDDEFVMTAMWADVLGQGTDSDTLIYRLHQP